MVYIIMTLWCILVKFIWFIVLMIQLCLLKSTTDLWLTTTTQYDYLLLVNRIRGRAPVMAGPIMIHHKKEKIAYRAFTTFIASLKPKLRSTKAFGTDDGVILSNTFKDEYANAIHLLCFIHFKNNIKDHPNKIVWKKQMCDLSWVIRLANK